MRRYIDAEQLEKDDWKLMRTPHGLRAVDCEIMELDCVPTADVVEVVRCKDCKWWKPFNDVMGHCGCDMRHKDFYCQRGVKP